MGDTSPTYHQLVISQESIERNVTMKAVMTQKEIEQDVDRLRAEGKLTRAIAIRYYCKDCSGGSAYSVKKCEHVKCPLWDFRQLKRNTTQAESEEE